jgi:hypothetical protein
MSVYKTNDNPTPGPVAQPRKGEGKMSDEELQRIMRGLVNEAETLIDGELSPVRAKATAYYRADPFGNEEDGRSQIVMSEVRDTIHAMLPGLLKKFFGPERAVEFVARTAAGVASAKQATDYVQYSFAEENAGFLRAYDVLKDGLVRRLGVFKYWWDDASHRAYTDEGVDHEALLALAARPDVEITHVATSDGDEYDAATTAGETYDVDYTVTIEGKPCITSVPTEEFLFNPAARDLEEALFVAHRTRKTRGELIALGYAEDVVDEHAGDSDALKYNPEAIERLESTNVNAGLNPMAGEANEEILYIESYPYLDVDGDGVAELRKVCMIGPANFVAHNEPAEERPFALFCPIPEPHTLVGQSEADLTMDIQLVKSSLTRSMLDSLALAIYPRMGFVEGQVSVEDLLNNAIGNPIRMKREGALQPITHAFTGEAAMPILEYFDAVKESRTGKSNGPMGLDSDSLQSSTQQAVTAAVSASQEQMDLVCRMFAEQALKPLFRGLYRLLVKYRPKARLVRLRGEYVPIDTMTWESDLDVSVNVAIGMSDVTNRIAALTMIAGKQEQILQMLGADNPLCTVAQLRETYARLTELSGFKDVTAFFKPVDPNWTPPQQPQTPPPPTPEQVMAQAQLQVEQMKTQKDLQIKQAELALKQQQQSFDQEIEIRKMANDFVLRRYQIDAQFKATYSQANLDADAAAQEAELKGVMTAHGMAHDAIMAEKTHALAAQGQAHDQSMERDQQAHDQQMAEQAAAQPEPPMTGTE